MLFSASPWQSAHDLLVAPALVFHSVSPSSTTSMAGLAVSSFCMARVSALMNSLSERRWSKGISAAGAAPAISVKVKTRAAGQLHLLPLPRGERAGVRGLGPLRRNPLIRGEGVRMRETEDLRQPLSFHGDRGGLHLRRAV